MSHRARLRLTGPWRRPDFLKLWAGQTVSKAGTLVTGFALPLAAILTLRASATQVALLTGASIVPRLALGLLAGVWVDRARRRPLMIAADVGRALIIGSVPIAALLGRLRIEQLYLVALTSSALSAVFDVAYPAYLPSLVPPEDLVGANSLLEASGAVAEVAGFGGAGALTQALTAPIALAVDAVSYVVSALSLLLIRAREPRPERPPAPMDGEPQSAKTVWREMGAGLRMLARDPVTRALAGASGVFELFGGMIGVVLMLYLVREVHLSPAALGIVFGVGGVSAFMGTLMAGRATRRWGIGRTVIGGLTIYTGSAVLMPLASGPAWLALTLLTFAQLTDCANTVYMVGRATLLQGLTDSSALGRVHAGVQMVESLATLSGVALGGVLGQTLGPRATLFISAGGLTLAPLVLARSPVRRLRQLPPTARHAELTAAPASLA